MEVPSGFPSKQYPGSMLLNFSVERIYKQLNSTGILGAVVAEKGSQRPLMKQKDPVQFSPYTNIFSTSYLQRVAEWSKALLEREKIKEWKTKRYQLRPPAWAIF